MKYLFPIVERQHKSTAIIKRENINIEDKASEIIVDDNLEDIKSSSSTQKENKSNISNIFFICSALKKNKSSY